MRRIYNKKHARKFVLFSMLWGIYMGVSIAFLMWSRFLAAQAIAAVFAQLLSVLFWGICPYTLSYHISLNRNHKSIMFYRLGKYASLILLLQPPLTFVIVFVVSYFLLPDTGYFLSKNK